MVYIVEEKMTTDRVGKETLAAEIKRLRAVYDEKRQDAAFRALVYGHFGTGKTLTCSTARAPVMIDTFDPHGITTVRGEIEEGRVIPVMFDTDTRGKPSEYARWEKEFKLRRDNGVFEHMGTYVIDSGTSFLNAAMNAIVGRNASKRPEGVPAIQDYMVQQIAIRDILMMTSDLPCDFIMTGHIDTTQDEVTGATVTSLACPRGLKVIIPTLFSEVYVTTVKQTSQGAEYKLLTQDNGVYRAETRIGRGIFDRYEEPNIKALLKKAGLPYEDKELIR